MVSPMKDSNTFSLYQNCDHNIYLKEKQKSNYVPMYKISPKKLDVVKWYLDSYLAKKFIQAILLSYSLPLLFLKKSSRKIWFYVDYRKLNTITKKDHYPIPLIEEILV